MATTTLDDRATTVDPAEAAKRLGVTKETLANWRWQKGDEGPPHVRVGRRVRYRLIDLAEWLEGQMRRSTSDRGTHV